jgi:hypothetical protein
MVYRYGQKLRKSKRGVKKYLVGIGASIVMVTGAAIPALAAGNGDGSNASSCGSAHGAFADSNGNFGFIGQDYQGAPNYHGGVQGQEPGATGYNNSHTGCQQL